MKKGVDSMTEESVLRYFGHMERVETIILVKRYTKENCKGYRPVIQLLNSYTDSVNEWKNEVSLSVRQRE